MDDNVLSIAVDASGAAYVTGNTISSDFPTSHAIQPVYGGGGDAFVAKLAPSGDALVYSTYFGAEEDEFGMGIALDSSRNAYLVGFTDSLTPPCYDGSLTDGAHLQDSGRRR